MALSSATRGYIGDSAAAVQHGEQGVRLAALDSRLFWHEGILAQAHYLNGDYERALEWVRSALDRNNRVPFNLRTLIASLAALGRIDQAAEAARHLLRLLPAFRLGPYSESCPFERAVLDEWLAHLRSAGLPE